MSLTSNLSRKVKSIKNFKTSYGKKSNRQTITLNYRGKIEMFNSKLRKKKPKYYL